jgi:adenosine deaminase CECR1
MTVADSPKKRKRVVSPMPSKRIPIQYTEPKTVDMAMDPLAFRAFFDAALGDANVSKAYSAEHAGLIQLENEDAWDREARPRLNSRSKVDQQEREAARIIRAIREYERKVVFGNQASEAIPGPETLDMGGQFLTNKERIDTESILYKIAHNVPKGGLLHLHFNAELHPERLLERARLIDNIYIRSIRPLLTQEDLDLTEIFSPTYPGNATNWKTEEWKWRVWVPWKKFQKDFEKHPFSKKYREQRDVIMTEVPHCCSEPGQVALEPAENWLKSKMLLSQEEAYGFTQTVNG